LAGAVVVVIGVAVVGADAIRGTSGSDSELAFTPDKAPPGSSIGVASAAGTATPTADGWTSTISLTVTDQGDTVVEGAKVIGKWSDDTRTTHCVTGIDGTCTFQSSHAASTSRSDVTWTLTSVSRRGRNTSAGTTSKITCGDPRHAAHRDADGSVPCQAVGTL